MINRLIASIFAVSALFAVRAADTSAWPIATTDEAVTGAWMNNFAAATNLAFETRAPMVLFWANHYCEYCEALESAVNSAKFKSWMSEHPDYIYCFAFGESGKDLAPNANSGAKLFAQTAGGTLSKLSSYPFLCYYWPRSDGTVLLTRKSGRAGSINAAAAAAGGGLADEFAASLEYYFGSYVPDSPVAFSCGDTEGDRLECEPKTAKVVVPMSRAGGVAKTTTLVVAWPDAVRAASTVSIDWAAGQTTAKAEIAMGFDEASFPLGKTASLTLKAEDGSVLDTTAITFVSAVENSPLNPYWLGEKTLDTLDWGDWTLDFDLATQKVARVNAAGTNAYTLALYSAQWCPYCAGMDGSLLKDEAFYAWLRENHVQLAYFDQALSPTDTYPGAGHLLTYEAGEEHINAAGSRHLVSGAPYLSRHGLYEFDDDVQAVHDRAVENSFSNWKAPESTAVRLSTPTFLLIGPAGNVIGRFAAWRDANNTLGRGEKYYETTENLARLDDLLRLATRSDENSDYESTTKLKLYMGTPVQAEYQISDTTECYRLEGMETGTLSVSAVAVRDVTLEFVVDGEVVASGVNTLSAKVKSAYLSSRMTLRTKGAMPAKLGGESSVYTATISASLVPGSGADEASAVASLATAIELETLATNATVTLKKTSGTLPSGLKLAYSKKTGLVTLSGTAKKAGVYTFTYQATVKTSEGRTVNDPVEIQVTVLDPQALNPYVNVARTQEIALLSADGSTLGGTLLVKLLKTGKISAKRLNTAGKSVTFSGTWAAIDVDDGTASAELTRSGETLALSLDASGVLTATVGALTGRAASGDTAKFNGYYTVTTPVVESNSAYPMEGTGYMLVTVKSGRATVKGVLPNSTAYSMTVYGAVDADDPDYLVVPVLKHTTKDTVALVLRIQANASTLYRDELTVRVVRAPLGFTGSWNHTVSGDTFAAELEVYGGYYVKSTKVDAWLSLYGLSSTEATLSGEATSIAWKLASTGLVSGSGKVTLEDGTVVSGTMKGVMLPGWIDCGCVEEEYEGEYVERPFASGSFYYKTRIGKKTVTASLPYDVIAK